MPNLDLQRLAAIIASSDDAIISKDCDGTITSWNEAAVRMFGYTAPEAIGQSIRIIIPADRQAEEDAVLARINKGDRFDHFETVRKRKDGTLIPISLAVSPILDTSGKVVGASKIARDISDRKRAEALTERSNRQATFLAEISAALTRTRNFEETLKTIASLAVPRIADWCGVDVVREDGSDRASSRSAHIDPAKIALAERLRERHESRDSSNSPPYRDANRHPYPDSCHLRRHDRGCCTGRPGVASRVSVRLASSRTSVCQ